MPNLPPAHTAPLLGRRIWLDRGLQWLRQRERGGLFVAVGMQIAVLLGMIALHLLPLLTGDTLLLRVLPADPRDLFRGDYVILRYPFSQIPPQGIAGLPSPLDAQAMRKWRGRPVYVSLVPESDGRHWQAAQISISPPPSGKFIRGRIASADQLLFGIEAYYVQEGQGQQFEQAIRHQRVSAEIALTRDGQAALRRLLVE